jgi:hypothetical protein
VHGTHQDRLVKKRYLEEHYLAEHNRRYARVAAEPADYHRKRPTARQLNEVFWLEEERVVSEDWVVRYKNRLLQLERQSQHWAPSRSQVRVRENEAGEIAIYYRGQPLRSREVPLPSPAMSRGRGAVECTPKVRQSIKGPATLNGGEQCWCPDKSISVN